MFKLKLNADYPNNKKQEIIGFSDNCKSIP